MKVLLDINDDKVLALFEVLKGLPYVNKQTIITEQDIFFKELEQSINEVNLAKQGKIKLKTLEELLDEL